ncbi:MAG: hypothetical protein GY774_40675 [Planctomycetes bacterium]|nr:hypothetical protein [Planctomycetota bacterium]
MTIEELADICEATAMAIQDVQVKYEMNPDPPLPKEDIPEGYEGHLMCLGKK